MAIRKYFYALPAVAALLLTASCSNQENEMMEAPQPAKTRIIPYTIKVSANSDTRLTLNVDPTNDKYKYTFEEGDRLYIWGSGGEGADAWTVGGELDWVENTENGASFSGGVAVTGEPVGYVTGVVKGNKDELLPATFKEFEDGGYEIAFPSDAIATDAKDAVEKYAWISGDAYFNLTDNAYFGVYHNTSYIEFDITLEDGTAADEALAVSITSYDEETSDDEEIRSGAFVTTKNVDGAIKATFVVPFKGNTSLKNATVKLGTKDAISFGGEGTWLSPNLMYRVTRTYTRYTITASMGTTEMMSSSNKPMGYETTLQELISKMPSPYNAMGSLVNNCEKSGTGTSVEVEAISGSSPKDFKFTVADEGNTDFTISTTLGTSFGITIGVAKMTPTAVE